jgi:hypothetical protein
MKIAAWTAVRGWTGVDAKATQRKTPPTSRTPP